VTVYLVIGSVGLGLVLLSLILGEIFDGVFEALDLDGGGIFSGPVIGSFLASFGFGAALVMYSTGIGAAGGALSGLATGLAVGGIALVIMRSLINMPTDENVRTTDLVGKTGTVVTRIPPGGMGEVTLTHAGQLMKLNARAAESLTAGTTVVVTAVTSASSVLVKPADQA
jgi:membrane protein implicated in regulation of membrane protease activity